MNNINILDILDILNFWMVYFERHKDFLTREDRVAFLGRYIEMLVKEYSETI